MTEHSWYIHSSENIAFLNSRIKKEYNSHETFSIFSFLHQIIKYFKSCYIMFRFADQVAIGDELLAQGYDILSPEKVINVSTFKMQGDYLSNQVFI